MSHPLTIAAAALAIGAGIAGCRMVETGESWSTKDESIPVNGQDAPTLHVETAKTTERPLEGRREFALDVLRQASDADYAQLRANAIEGMRHAPDQLDPLVRRGLVDVNRGVRFTAAMTIGRNKMQHLVHLLEPMLRDQADSVRAAAMYGLKRCGKPVDLSPLSEMILSDSPEIRANAAMVLGDLGNPSAVPVVRQAIGHGMDRVNAAKVKIVDLQLAEALVNLGEDRQLEVIRAALFAPSEQGELTALACMMCGRLHDERTVPDLIRLARITGQFQQPAEVRMAATWALARIDVLQALSDVPMGYLSDPQYQLRVQAALTLGEIGDPAFLPALTTSMSDENPLVQVAAASAVLQILNPSGP